MTSPERRAPKAVHFTRREGRKGTLSGTQTLPFHSKGGSDRGGGSPSSNTSTTVHFAPWEGHMGGGSPRPGHRHTSMWWPQPAAHTCMVVACACAHSYRHCLRTLTHSSMSTLLFMGATDPPRRRSGVHFAPGEGGRVGACDPPPAAPELSISEEGHPPRGSPTASISGGPTPSTPPSP